MIHYVINSTEKTASEFEMRPNVNNNNNNRIRGKYERWYIHNTTPGNLPNDIDDNNTWVIYARLNFNFSQKNCRLIRKNVKTTKNTNQLLQNVLEEYRL